MSMIDKLRQQYLQGQPLEQMVKLPGQDTVTFINAKSYGRLLDLTAIYPGRGEDLTYPILGLVSEAGEVADKAKKLVRDQGGSLKMSTLTKEQAWELALELCDNIWYEAELGQTLGLTLEDLILINTAKLLDRLERNQLKGSGDHR